MDKILYLREQNWPVDRFIDLYMRANKVDNDKELTLFGFGPYLFLQVCYVKDGDKEALQKLYKRITGPFYIEHDKEGLHKFLDNLLRSS